MAIRELDLPVSPAELLLRLPPSPGVFLLDGGNPDSWGEGEAWLGCEPREFGSAGAPAAAREGTRAAEALLARACEASRRLRASRPSPPPPEPAGGVLLALGYELGRVFEPALPEKPSQGPVLFYAVHPWLLAYSYRERRYTLRSRVLSPSDLDRRARWLEKLAFRPLAPEAPVASRFSRPVCLPERPAHLRAVSRALEYIRAGDIYQVNLAVRFSLRFSGCPRRLFRSWLARHPAPFSGYLEGDGFALLSNSPECFLRRRGFEVATFPIKGTMPRGRTPEEDRALGERLLGSPKDLAEHVMIVDLERNDLGRVCRIGTVHVRTLARLETLPTLFHLESEVAGTLRPGVTTEDLLRATFPGGSITGAPKIRAMEIIDELEPFPRGFYTGSLGLLDGEEWFVSNIAIRTAVLMQNELRYYAGGGIVADSVPEREHDEVLLKARSFFEVARGGRHELDSQLRRRERTGGPGQPRLGERL
ncbi:MAG: hypothetical protein KatS3mg076_2219 [Candidatus Binatia bacterium]|nr:MAG: hypothetical protein KatS3mg076_2219 [Candidatus Binatia bacterium]